MDAPVDGTSGPGTTSSKLHRSSKLSIHTLLRTDNALPPNPLVAKSESAPTLEFPQDLFPSTRLVSNRVSSVLLLQLAALPSSCTDLVSSPDLPAELTSITPSPSSVGELRMVR